MIVNVSEQRRVQPFVFNHCPVDIPWADLTMEQSTENIAAIATCDIFLYVAKVVHNMSTVARSIAYNINYMLLGH